MNKGASDLIDAFGGNDPLSELLGVGSSAVSNYRQTGFPSWTYLKLAKEGAKRKIKVNPSLFKSDRGGK